MGKIISLLFFYKDGFDIKWTHDMPLNMETKPNQYTYIQIRHHLHISITAPKNEYLKTEELIASGTDVFIFDRGKKWTACE